MNWTQPRYHMRSSLRHLSTAFDQAATKLSMDFERSQTFLKNNILKFAEFFTKMFTWMIISLEKKRQNLRTVELKKWKSLFIQAVFNMEQLQFLEREAIAWCHSWRWKQCCWWYSMVSIIRRDFTQRIRPQFLKKVKRKEISWNNQSCS